MTIDLNEILKWVTALVGIGTPIAVCIKKMFAIIKRIENLYSWNHKQQEDIESVKENNLAQNKALLAMARSMKEKGFNNTIDEAIKTLEDAILYQQAKSYSYNEK